MAKWRKPRVKSIKPPSDPVLAALREEKILPVIRDLKSADPKSRAAAAAAVSNIIQDERCRKLLLREKIVHTVLTQTLTDAALESRAAGWGILQVLAQEEEPDFCVHLYRVDALTAIEYAAKSTLETLQSKDVDFQKRPKAEQATILSIASSLVSLLSALAEAQDEILEAIARNPVIPRLLFLLSSNELSHIPEVVSLRTDTLACLMILCEDNQELSQKIVNSKESRCFDSILSLREEPSSDGVLACGVLHNIFTSVEGQDLAPGVDDSILIPTLCKAVESFQLGQVTTDATGWSNPIEYQQLALELLASIGTNLNNSRDAGEPPKPKTEGIEDDESMDDADVGDAGSDGEGPEGEAGEEEEDDDEMDDEMEADMEMVTGADDDDRDDIDDFPVLKGLIQSALPELIRISSLYPDDDAGIRLQSHALSALNNIAWSVSLIDFSDSHNAAIQAAWRPAGYTLWARVIGAILSTDTADITLATHITSLAWAVARSLHTGSTGLGGDEHRRFIALYRATQSSEAAQNSEDPFQALGVKCIGVLGQLALDPAPTDRNREVATFLIALLAGLPNTPPADAVEALNQLFDIYGNEDYAYDLEVFWKDNFLKHLEDAVPKIRAMVKSINKQEQSELRLRADEAALNLNRFLAYKRKNKPKA
ncbi:hypothetical protein EDB81DRAFT_328538 [Dactylonectria macrodidyma]|uniref:SYO1-like TPR repeats domain-containing protein n=1 Tax=Dactylonectria macrodidyma TaxID=307937 RepID=A0A9P9JCY0_9HYPO|nr:hypothetical protein EDB81DRAFT_328538 [Dactylonectria macrodidyma]